MIDIGDGDAAIFKMESHNHPSYIEPYQGAATGVGGILRDVFTMGARPIANLNALRFGRPDHPKTRHLVAGVVAGIGGYGNCVGVPTVGGEVNFDAAYDGNILVNAMTVGVAKTDKIFYSAAAGIGNSVVYVGSKTGRDGIHGATMASADFSEDSEEKRPTVQVGDPFTEKLLIEACLELMASDAIVAIQDMGAAGLTSSSVEMASKGGVGIRLDMNKVPCREEGMTPYEMMLSESQERMLMVLKPGREAEAEAIFRKWELDFAVIGEVTDTGRMELVWNGETVADIPLDPLADEAPLYERPYAIPKPPEPLTDIPESTDIAADLLKLMASPDARQPPLGVGAVRPVGRRRHRPAPRRRRGGGARPRLEEGAGDHHRLHAALLLRRPGRGREAGGRRSLSQPLRGRREAAGDHQLPQLRQPAAARDHGPVRRLHRRHGRSLPRARLPRRERQRQPLQRDQGRGRKQPRHPPHPRDRRRRPARRLGEVARRLGSRLKENSSIASATREDTSASHFGCENCTAERTDLHRRSTLDAERRTGEGIRELIRQGWITAIHDVADGGLAVALAEMSLAGGMGADVRIEPYPGSSAGMFFGEDQAVVRHHVYG